MPDGDFVGGRRPLVPPDVKMEVMLGGRGVAGGDGRIQMERESQ